LLRRKLSPAVIAAAKPARRAKVKGRPTDAASFRLAPFQPRDESLTAPEFNRMAIHELHGPLDCVGIVVARERLEVDEVPVEPDGISPVICHRDLPHQRMPGNVGAVAGSRFHA
jgi:hypothetical protein